MQIDWITVSAQIVNFLILVWLLKHFLYQPVMRAMGRREQRIKDRLTEAGEREQQARQQRDQYQQKEQQLDQQRDAIMTRVKEEAEQQKRRMLDEARDEVTEKKGHWQQQIEQEKEEFLKSLRGQSGEVIQAIARKALAELADTSLEEHIIESFINRLQLLDKETRKALANTSEAMRIATSFELSSDVRSRLTRAVHENIVDNIDVQYSQSPDLVCGIELVTGGRQLSWSVASYLDELSSRVGQAFATVESAAES